MTCVKDQAGKMLHGFTLIEVLAAITVIATIASVSSMIMFNSIDSYTASSISAGLNKDMTIALEQVVRHLRKIELDSSATETAPNINNVTTTSIDWSDSGLDAYNLSLSGSNLMLSINGGGSNLLLTDVSGMTIQTYDQSNNPLPASLSGSACDQIRRIAVDITLTRGGESQSLGMKVFLRSTMSGGGT